LAGCLRRAGAAPARLSGRPGHQPGVCRPGRRQRPGVAHPALPRAGRHAPRVRDGTGEYPAARVSAWCRRAARAAGSAGAKTGSFPARPRQTVVRFRLVHKLTSYLLAGTALATLATSETASWLSLLVITLAAIVSWFVEPDTRLGTLFDRAVPLLNVVTVALFALAVLQVARSFPDVDLSPFLDFVLFLLGYKLCQRHGNRDYLQIYILSFLVMLAAAWQATSAVFVV